MTPLEDGDVVRLGEGRLIINPGGVGQPRDGDRPRFLRRVRYQGPHDHPAPREYDLERAQRKIREAGLPPYLAERLAHGR